MNYGVRQKKLAAQLHRTGVEALLITHLPNIRYLCGFTGTAGVLLLHVRSGPPKMVFFTDGRYTQQATEQVKSAKVVITKKPALVHAGEWLVKSKIGKVAFEAEHLSHAAYKQVRQLLPGKAKLVAAGGQIEALRTVKDSDEVDQIRAAVLMAAGLFPASLTNIRPGIAEAMIAGELELQARRAGAEKMSFDTIVAAGVRSALPHGRASTQPVPESGFIILDYGVILAGYCSDMTRTVHVGGASKAHRRMYEAVKEAQLASIEMVRPGVEAGAVDQAGRQVLKKAGYGAYFTHSTGHGVGIEVHESPRLAKGLTQKLVPGMVVTIEPGIYIAGDGGVRIEDMVLVTESGHEILTPTSKDLIEV
ncbi:MAG TPA: Xaa-Pro peptidase family protein [Candidatus Angelobacter sp.]|jgi:Xaa-Pro aminopeptidase|nr:Xaa-Pro peptidase family protein [Candidatus Angelobacter sp.]